MLARQQIVTDLPEAPRNDSAPNAASNGLYKPNPQKAPDYQALRAYVTAKFSKTLEYLAK